ncbi:MAG: hypothetical protein QOJ79_2068 [Actinomycetota bacterium]|jgi:hypothetical protein|nr:hypothetical protein [Actinomycetota bacterium]
MGVAQDDRAPMKAATAAPGAYTEHEERALSLAAELRARVQRERTTVARLQAYLTGQGRAPKS